MKDRPPLTDPLAPFLDGDATLNARLAALQDENEETRKLMMETGAQLASMQARHEASVVTIDGLVRRLSASRAANAQLCELITHQREEMTKTRAERDTLLHSVGGLGL